ncbi:MAG: hypothetical protein QM820_43750 [Minicystis sp.]
MPNSCCKVDPVGPCPVCFDPAPSNKLTRIQGRRIMSSRKLACLAAPIVAALVLGASSASAQEKDGARFRGGIALTGAGLFISDYALGLGGIDGRLGVQINNLIGVYAQPYISFGGGKVAGITGFTGTAGSTLNVDFTFMNQFFVGAGGGGGIIGSLGAGQAVIRVGGYPLFTHGENRIRRKGLMLSADMHIHIGLAGGASYKLLQPTFAIGYEAF